MADNIPFEQKLGQLEEILSKLDEGSLPMEETIKLYEEGMRLASECREYLNKAELRITEIASGKSG